MHNPLDHFDEEKADKLLTHCKKLFANEQDAWLHLIGAAFAICPDTKMNHVLLDCLEINQQAHDQATENKNEH